MKDISELIPTIICFGALAVIFAPLIFWEMTVWGPARTIRQKAELEEKNRIFTTAKVNYENSLKLLKNKPTNPDIKQKTLYLGRVFSDITRQFEGTNGVTLFDEVALMNDINAACAGATISSSRETIATTIEQRLVKLAELKEMGLLKEQEYEERRRKILDEV